MKKILLILLLFVLGINLVLAFQEGLEDGEYNSLDKDLNDYGNQLKSTERNEMNEMNQGIGQELREQIRERKEEIKAGEYNDSLGRILRVRELVNHLKELRVNNVSAETGLNITVELDEEGKTRLRTRLKNGQEREIKIMPDSALERALERLQLKVCSVENNCTIQLKNVGEEENERIQYEMQIRRHSKILGIFQKKMQLRAEIDAETGETKLHKPWWAFLATEPEE